MLKLKMVENTGFHSIAKDRSGNEYRELEAQDLDNAYANVEDLEACPFCDKASDDINEAKPCPHCGKSADDITVKLTHPVCVVCDKPCFTRVGDYEQMDDPGAGVHARCITWVTSFRTPRRTA